MNPGEDGKLEQLGLPERESDNGHDAEQFIQRMVASLVVAKVRQQRSEGLGDQTIRQSVLALALDRAIEVGGSDFDSAQRREHLGAWIEAALDDTLADPGPSDFAEPLRRITERVEGEPILLVNGEVWTFPRLDLQKFPRTMADGSIDLQYVWLQDPDGIDLLTELIWIDNGISDPRTVLPHLMSAATLLLRRNYSLTVMECRQLMPIDPENPECIGGLIALASEESPAASSIATGPFAGHTEAIVQALLTLLAPVIEDIRNASAED